MREQKIVPGLLHDPGATRQRPWTVSDVLQQRVQESVYFPATKWPLRIHKGGG
jgi:hypothetical protein